MDEEVNFLAEVQAQEFEDVLTVILSDCSLIIAVTVHSLLMRKHSYTLLECSMACLFIKLRLIYKKNFLFAFRFIFFLLSFLTI
jgi:hypothetical protein